MCCILWSNSFFFSVMVHGGLLPPPPQPHPLDHLAVKVVGWELARSRGGSEIGGVITGKGAVKTGGWVLANHWEIDEESTTRVGLHTTQTANQHQQKTSTNTQESHKTDNSTQFTNNRKSKTIGFPSKKGIKNQQPAAQTSWYLVKSTWNLTNLK